VACYDANNGGFVKGMVDPTASNVCKRAAQEVHELVQRIREGHRPMNVRELADDYAAIALESGPWLVDRMKALTSAGGPDQKVTITRPALLCYVIQRALASDVFTKPLREPCGNGTATLREKLALTSALLNVLVAILSQRSGGELSEAPLAAEDVISLLCEVARREYGLDCALDIRGDLLRFGRVEPALYLWKDYYRDHLFHVADVCMLGLLLLDSEREGEPRSLAAHFARCMRASEQAVYGNWFLAALLHDVGYTIDVAGAALKQLNNLKSDLLKGLRKNLNECLKETDEAIRARLGEVYPNQPIEGLDHGVVSSLHLQAMLEKTGRPALVGKYNPAYVAIQKHNLHLAINMLAEPLSALLVLCDELQEWERPRMDGRRLAQHIRGVGNGGADHVPQATIAESLTFSKASMENGRMAIQDGLLNCAITYRYPEDGKFWPPIVCMTKCHAFQRIDPRGFPLRFRIQLINPYPPGNHVREYGAEALRNYALRHPESGLLNLFDGREGLPSPVDFAANPGPIETVTIDLERLHRVAPLPIRLAVDWSDLTRWPPMQVEPYALEMADFLRENG